MLVSTFQLMITIGVLVSFLTDLYFADEADMNCWRPMFYVGVIPAIILFVGMIFMPESPRWLLTKNKEIESRKILNKIEGEAQAELTINLIKEEAAKDISDKSAWKSLFESKNATPLFIAIGIMFFQQFVGINTVIYYSPKIFLMAGFDSTISAIWASVGIGFVNVIFSLVSIYFIDRLGRRKLYFIGLTGIASTMLLLSLAFIYINILGVFGQWLLVLLVFAYVAFFAISIGPLGWLIISEIFPQKIRGLGTSIGALSVWIFNSIVTFTFFKIVHLLSIPAVNNPSGIENTANPAGAFLFYGGIAVLAIIWGYFYVPETKGVPLEIIEKFWEKGGRPNKLHKE
jgi:MFS transporter, SP family, galactose:H+ symporter